MTTSRKERELSVKEKEPVNLLRISILVGWSKASTSPSITWLWHVLHETRLPTEKYSLPSDAIFWLKKKKEKILQNRGETQQHHDQTTLLWYPLSAYFLCLLVSASGRGFWSRHSLRCFDSSRACLSGGFNVSVRNSGLYMIHMKSRRYDINLSYQSQDDYVALMV